MPTYDYRATDPEKACDACRENFEVIQRMADDPLVVCTECGNPISRIIGAAGIVTRPLGDKGPSDKQLKNAGFKKFVKEDKGKYRNVLA